MKNKKVLIFVVLIIIAVAVGVGVYFATSSKDDKAETKKDTPKQEANAGENVEEQEQPPEVTYLEFPDKSEAERQILERYSNNNDYKVIPVSGSKFSGYLVAVYEPSRMHVVVTSKMGVDGEYVDKMVSDNNALVGINAGGFADADFNGDGSNPAGLTIARNKMVVSDKYTNARGGIV
ncbi:MAG: hypothetical protein IJ867_04125 [Clostridia bacterium]|nr:hypothetical protein [Clostridia bacterium]